MKGEKVRQTNDLEEFLMAYIDDLQQEIEQRILVEDLSEIFPTNENRNGDGPPKSQ